MSAGDAARLLMSWRHDHPVRIDRSITSPAAPQDEVPGV